MLKELSSDSWVVEFAGDDSVINSRIDCWLGRRCMLFWVCLRVYWLRGAFRIPGFRIALAATLELCLGSFVFGLFGCCGCGVSSSLVSTFPSGWDKYWSLGSAV